MNIINASSDNHRAQMQTLGDFIGADEIIYTDLGNGEDYRITKNGATLMLKVRGNNKDGGFLCVDSEVDPWKTAIIQRS